MFDRYRKAHKTPRASTRLRIQIAVEAARRMYDLLVLNPGEEAIRLGEATENEYYAAKRKAAAVLGHRVRPGDLPTNAEVREQVLLLAQSRAGFDVESDNEGETDEEPVLEAISDHLDRFAIYKLRLVPLESVKQNPRLHPEGDALFHSLQVFERARDVRPYDEEFLLAALLHDVGKAIDPQNPVAASVQALRGAVTERTLWLIEHHKDMVALRDRTISQRSRRALEASDFLDDLKLLVDLDEAGRVPGVPVASIDEALAYLRGLEDESYLEG